MTLIDWTPELAIGVKLIDQQHGKLTELVNRVADALAAESAPSELTPLLNELVQYSEFHFQSEEQLMYQHFYVSRLPHKEAHLHLAQQIRKLRDDVAAGNPQLTADTLDFLRRWLLDHILHADKAVGLYLNTRGVH